MGADKILIMLLCSLSPPPLTCVLRRSHVILTLALNFRHHRTGIQWKIYPIYDFCAPILDSWEGITVALRTNEYRDRNVQYEWMQDGLGLRKVTIWDFSVKTPDTFPLLTIS